jgi:uncharacterized protein HemY
MLKFSTVLILMIVPAVICIYTINYGYKLGKAGNTRGAIGVIIVAAVCVIAPLILMLLKG